MADHEQLTQQFEAHRPRLRAVAYRLLGSLSEADDAVQDTWLRFRRTDPGEIGNLGGWLTTVVARVALNLLRSRASRREEPLGVHLPDPIVSRADATDPEQQAVLADAVGLAMLVVLDTLAPAERVAFVLHDAFGVPFDQVAAVVGRSPAATRQLASRARRRVRQAAPVPDPDLDRQREAVDAFLAAARSGDLDALLGVLDPDVVARADRGAAPAGLPLQLRGAHGVAEQAVAFARIAPSVHPVLVNGAAGVVATAHGRPFSLMGFIVRDGRITVIDILLDPERLRRLDLAALGA